MITLLQSLLKTENRKSLHFYSGLQKVESLSPAEVYQHSLERVHFIQAQWKEEQFVHLCMKNSPEFLKSLFAIWMAGKTPVPLPVRDYVSSDYFRLLLTSASEVTGSRKVLVESTHDQLPVEGLHFLQIQPGEPYRGPLRQADLALLQFSSGSTQKPKAVILTADKILKNVAQITQGIRASSDEVLTTWLPFYHDMGLIGGLLGILFANGHIHVHNPGDFLADPKEWMTQVGKNKTTVLMGPNLLYKKMMDVASRVSSLDLSSVRVAFIGAEPVDGELLKKFSGTMKAYGFSEKALFPVYGMAENVLAVTFPRLNSQIQVHEKENRHWVSCGWPLPEIELKIVDDRGHECCQGVIGRILIKTPSQTEGYYANEAASKELFEDGYLKTGDLGFFIQEKGLFITGREKELIIQNGRKWFPVDLEWTLKESGLAGLGRTAVVSNQDEHVFIVVETKIWSRRRRHDLEQKIRKILQAKFLIQIHQVLAVPPCALPRTSSGKMKRRETLSLLQEGLLSLQRNHYFIYRIRSQMNFISKAFLYLQSRRRKNLQKNSVRDLLAEHLIQSVRSIVRSPQTLTAQTRFLDLNMDSIQVIELNTQLERNFAVIPLEKFIHLQTVQCVADFLIENHQQEVRAWADRSQMERGA